MQGERGQLTGALPFTLQQLVDVLLQKQLSAEETKGRYFEYTTLKKLVDRERMKSQGQKKEKKTGADQHSGTFVTPTWKAPGRRGHSFLSINTQFSPFAAGSSRNPTKDLYLVKTRPRTISVKRVIGYKGETLCRIRKVCAKMPSFRNEPFVMSLKGNNDERRLSRTETALWP